MTAGEPEDPPPAEALWSDQEMVAASGVPLPSLRVLQSAGAIRSEKAPKFHGGFRRMWPENHVLRASIAAALGEHFAWNIRLVATVMAKVQPALWDTPITVAASELRDTDPTTLKRTLVTASELDWHAELVDRKFVFLKVPEYFTLVLPGWTSTRKDLLLGVLETDSFIGISWELGTPRRRKAARDALGEEKAQKLIQLYKLALASHGNFLSKATINLSLQIRAAWRRLHGLESRFVQETVQLRGRTPT